MKTLGELLKERRQRLGLSLAEAAAKATLSREHLSAFESGRRWPSVDTLLQLTHQYALDLETCVPAYLHQESRCKPLIRLARALLQSSKINLADKTLQLARRLNRAHYSGRYNGEIYELSGKIAYAQGRYHRAVCWFRRLERVTARVPHSNRRWISTYNYALALGRVGRFSEALHQFDLAIAGLSEHRMFKELGVAYLAKGNLLLRLESTQEAARAYRKASFHLRGHPLRWEALLGSALCTWIQRGPSQALSALERFFPFCSTPLQCAKVHANPAVAVRQLGRSGDALTHLQRALSLAPSEASAVKGSLLAELCLLSLRTRDIPVARQALAEFSALSGPKDAQDVVSMHILASLLRMNAPPDPLPRTLADDYQGRVRAAVSLLLEAAAPRVLPVEPAIVHASPREGE